jgi:hypothetical protein
MVVEKLFPGDVDELAVFQILRRVASGEQNSRGAPGEFVAQRVVVVLRRRLPFLPRG